MGRRLYQVYKTTSESSVCYIQNEHRNEGQILRFATDCHQRVSFEYKTLRIHLLVIIRSHKSMSIELEKATVLKWKKHTGFRVDIFVP